MKYLRFFLAVILMVTVSWAADDGPLFMRNLSETPKAYTEHVSLDVMPLYVPAQDPQGDPPETASGELEYYAGDCTNQDTSACDLIYTRSEAKPLVATFLDGEVTFIDGLAFIGHGERDAFLDLSLDDGATWKKYNLSESADLSSFTLKNGTRYPGDVFDVATAVLGKRILVAWASRYCGSGDPSYSWTDEVKAGLLESYPELEHEVDVDGGTDPDGFYQIYLDDLFSVGGDQVSSDYADEGYPEIGEIPYACLWVARGSLEQARDKNTGEPMSNDNGDPIYDITWRAAERITSGVRDVNRVEIASASGAGFAVVWQEDPDGLRPGKALCADGGFRGAVAHQGTDIWYSHIDLDHFDDVCIDEPGEDVYCTTGTLAEFADSDLFGVEPKAAVPLAMPVRLTDNAACLGDQKFDTNGDLLDPYCYADFDGNGTADFCATTESWTNPGGTTLQVCVTEDDRHLVGRTAATRARLAMKPYTTPEGVVSAWIALVHEEDKALGSIADPDQEPIDIGKNAWYHTFEYNEPELVGQGLMLNAPALVPRTDELFTVQTDEWGFEFYLTEIARDGRLAVQGNGSTLAATEKTSSLLLYKQGVLDQGGPADIFLRRVVLPDDFDQTVDNPFAYENVACVAFADDGTATDAELLYADGSNPNYIRGLCPVEGMNVSSTTIVACDEGSSGETCAEQFPLDSEDDEPLPKVTEWAQAPDNYNDPSWMNPYDISRDQQAFIDGDFVMLLYSLAPNWEASANGNDAYNLYARRSFDGGQSWTTLPASYNHIDGITYEGGGTTTCEDYGWTVTTDYEICTDYDAGEFEQARNLTRLPGGKITTLDPRHTPTGGVLKQGYSDLLCDDDLDGIWENCGYTDNTDSPYDEEIRDPSAYFITYGTGDNTVVDEGILPTPLNLYYGKASDFGDDYDQQDICSSPVDAWYPAANKACSGGGVVLAFDWLENDKYDQAWGVDLTANPIGDRLYAVWNEADFNKKGSVLGVDAMFRRIFYNLAAEGD